MTTTKAPNEPSAKVSDEAVEAVQNIIYVYDVPKSVLRLALTAALPHLTACVGEGWRTIESAPKDDTQILAVTEDGRIMIWSAEMLARVMSGKQPFHLQFPATHWMPLPTAPTPEASRG